ncbi:MAG: 4-hydroxy-tetrahydrodipicolinate reductase [Actinomycetota bacterium]
MGREVCRTVNADADLELVAAVDPSHAGQVVEGIALTASLDALTEAGAEVAVEFTRPEAAPDNIAWCVAHGLHVVSGTTGFEPDPTWAEQRDVGVCIAANFAIGAVLLMRFAEEAARHLPDVEIIELHHADKPDAPSGTSMATARRVAAARDPEYAPPDASVERVSGARGADVEGIRVHSVRLPGLVAHQEVILGGLGQTLTIRHDSLSHVSFMPGVLTAVKAVRSRPGLTIGLDALLGAENG